jgi:transaldolase
MLLACTSTTPAIISVFGGRISDTGIEPHHMIRHAVQSVRQLGWVEILWAGVKDNLVIQYANEIGCHIVTVPDAIISRLNRIGQQLDTLSQDTVASFLKDGVEALSIQ